MTPSRESVTLFSPQFMAPLIVKLPVRPELERDKRKGRRPTRAAHSTVWRVGGVYVLQDPRGLLRPPGMPTEAWSICQGYGVGLEEKDVVLPEASGVCGGHLRECVRHPADVVAAVGGRTQEDAGVGRLALERLPGEMDEVPQVAGDEAPTGPGRILELGPVRELLVSRGGGGCQLRQAEDPHRGRTSCGTYHRR
jgi:hypothetical protein